MIIVQIEIIDIINLNKGGFRRNAYPAFNVSENRFANKNQYTKDLYLTLTDSESKGIYFKNGILKGRVIREIHDKEIPFGGSIDFLITEFEGDAYSINGRTPLNKNDLQGHIIFDINHNLYTKISWQDNVEWGENQKNKDIDPHHLVEWDVEDIEDKLELDDEEEFVIDTLYGMLENYVDDSEKINDNYKKSYLMGVAKSLKITIESLQKGGLTQGIDAVSNVYQKNCKKRFKELQNINNFGEDYYICAGMLWGYRTAIEYVSGFPELWQYSMRAEGETTTIDEMDELAIKYPKEFDIRDGDDNFYMYTGIFVGVVGTFIGNILSHKYLLNSNKN